MPLGFNIDENSYGKSFSFGKPSETPASSVGGGFVADAIFNEKERRDVDLSGVSAFCNPKVS